MFLCRIVLLAWPVGATAQEGKLTHNPVRTFEDVLAVMAGDEAALIEVKKGREHWDRGEFEPARACFEQSLALLVKQFPDESPVVGQCHGMLAVYYWSVGDPASALPHARKHLATSVNFPRARMPLQYDLNRSLALNNLGGVLEELGDLAEAEKLYGEALELRRKLNPGQDHVDLVASLGNLVQDQVTGRASDGVAAHPK